MVEESYTPHLLVYVKALLEGGFQLSIYELMHKILSKIAADNFVIFFCRFIVFQNKVHLEEEPVNGKGYCFASSIVSFDLKDFNGSEKNLCFGAQWDPRTKLFTLGYRNHS